MELMYICYNMSHQWQLSTSKKNFPLHIVDKVFSLIVPYIVILYGLTYLGELQYNV